MGKFKRLWKKLWEHEDFGYGGSMSYGGILSVLAISTVVVGGVSYCGHKMVEAQKQKKAEAFEKSQKPIVGEVVDKVYERKLEKVPEVYKRGLVSQAYSGETVKLDSKYILKLRTLKDREIGVSVLDSQDKDKESLGILVDIGSVVSFPRGNIGKSGDCYSTINKETYFKESTQFGNKRVDRIEVLEQ
jgi:hypothetical protein